MILNGGKFQIHTLENLKGSNNSDDKVFIFKWLEFGTMISSEGMDWIGLSKRLENLLHTMTLSIFAANILHNFTFTFTFIKASTP